MMLLRTARTVINRRRRRKCLSQSPLNEGQVGPEAAGSVVDDLVDGLGALVEDVLKPGGTLLMYEHVLSHHEDVAWWQRFWTPMWSRGCDGCRLDRPSHLWIERMDGWAEGKVWGLEDEPEEHLFWHRIGRFVKKST